MDDEAALVELTLKLFCRSLAVGYRSLYLEEYLTI